MPGKLPIDRVREKGRAVKIKEQEKQTARELTVEQQRAGRLPEAFGEEQPADDSPKEHPSAEKQRPRSKKQEK